MKTARQPVIRSLFPPSFPWDQFQQHSPLSCTRELNEPSYQVIQSQSVIKNRSWSCKCGRQPSHAIYKNGVHSIKLLQLTTFTTVHCRLITMHWYSTHLSSDCFSPCWKQSKLKCLILWQMQSMSIVSTLESQVHAWLHEETDTVAFAASIRCSHFLDPLLLLLLRLHIAAAAAAVIASAALPMMQLLLWRCWRYPDTRKQDHSVS